MKKQLFMTALLVLMLALPAFAATNDRAVLNLEFVNQKPDPVEPGNYVELRWIVNNAGDQSDNFVFEFVNQYPFTIDDTNNQIQSKRIAGGTANEDGTVLYFRVRVDENAVQGDNTVKIRYKQQSATQYIELEQDVRVESKQGLVQVKDVSLTPQDVTVGSQFVIDVAVENLGNSFISNVQVQLDTEDTGFTPIGSSSVKTIKQINGKTAQYVSFDYAVDSDTEIKVQAIPITITYFDSTNQLNTISTKIGIPLSANPTYLFNLEQTAIQTSGSKGNAVISISNIGKSDINFVVLELMESDDYEVLSTRKSYLGNLESDDFETGQYEIYIYETEAASVPLNFKMTYRDEYDQVFADEFTVDHRVFNAQEAKQFGIAQGGSGGIIFGILGFILVIGGIIFWSKLVIRLFKKKR